MAKVIAKKAFRLTRDDGSTVDYAAGDTVSKEDAEHWYTKAHLDDALADDEQANRIDEAAQNPAGNVPNAEAQKQAEAATKAGDTVRASTKG
ncbi:hypothetical protein [Caballeronia sp. INDeC2]|uniref:hypothetical protein n=1 Tax=Caballeronia sp. INDeC2 TaxID=2921747 RepID=UPI002029840D|nr:hypothetical protein [Caballeronia sp. INDeC2]